MTEEKNATQIATETSTKETDLVKAAAIEETPIFSDKPAFKKQNKSMGRGSQMAASLAGGAAFGLIVPVLAWDQAFNTRIGWTFGLISIFLGLLAGLIFSLMVSE